MSDLSDSELMARYADGDARAFDQLYDRYEQRAYGYFLRRTRSEERASDLYQELFLRLHRFRDRYDPKRPFAPWFFQIARRVLTDDYRRSMRRHEVRLEEESQAARESDVEHQTLQRDHVQQLLSVLAPGHAQVLVAAKVGGLEYSEVADDVGKSIDAVKQIASRALRRLRSADGVGV